MYVHTYVCMYVCMHAYVRTYVRTYVHTYIHTYIHTYGVCIHACIHACMYVGLCLPRDESTKIEAKKSPFRPLRVANIFSSKRSKVKVTELKRVCDFSV